MEAILRLRYGDFGRAFAHPVTVWLVVGIVAGLVLSAALVFVLQRLGKIGPEQSGELWARLRSWVWLSALMAIPVLLGSGWTMLAITALGLACFREYTRVTGLFREKLLSGCVIAGILAVAFAAFDHYDRLFFAAAPLVSALLVAVTITLDRPKGYLQRTALAILGFLLFGYSLGYLSNLANVSDLGNGADYRPVLLLILVSVELNDVFAYCCGKLIGGPKLLPQTSPGKTIAGSAGALVLTTALVAGIGAFLFAGTPMARIDRLMALGLLISGLGQLGDLVLSSIKRDVGIKDTGTVIPGHGGLLDRFDSLLLVPPAVYHYLSYCLGPLGAEQAARIITGP